jgi:hypothetical protein
MLTTVVAALIPVVVICVAGIIMRPPLRTFLLTLVIISAVSTAVGTIAADARADSVAFQASVRATVAAKYGATLASDQGVYGDTRLGQVRVGAQVNGRSTLCSAVLAGDEPVVLCGPTHAEADRK